jgi:hypothetical protein
MMRYDTTPAAPFIMPFYQYQPDPTAPRLIQLLNSQVRQLAQEALENFYPVLKKYARLGEIFWYQSLPDLVSRLDRNF